MRPGGPGADRGGKQHPEDLRFTVLQYGRRVMLDHQLASRLPETVLAPVIARAMPAQFALR